ncbi:hypothetical protein ACFCYF_23670 [Streptomyces chartreusis]|uniref:hypothetical protein n=1 Tax=Streptomyces chartreusis TaxID=1969 RepID=UPI0035D56A01
MPATGFRPRIANADSGVPFLDDPQSRVDAALRLLTTHDIEDIDTLSLAVLLILDPPHELLGTDLPPSCPPAAVLQERVADRLAESWPRLAYGDFTTDLARDAMTAAAPVLDQLQQAARFWRQRTVNALAERDRARDLAVTLEQLTAEAARLLNAGQPEEALTVLEGDGSPLDASRLATLVDGTPGARPAVHDDARASAPASADDAPACPGGGLRSEA